MKVMLDKMEVYVLVSHLIITLAIIGVYCYTLITGQGDETLKTILTVIVGYWFGSMGVNAIKSPNQNSIETTKGDDKNGSV